jgi:hypothetical protein
LTEHALSAAMANAREKPPLLERNEVMGNPPPSRSEVPRVDAGQEEVRLREAP